MFVPDTPLAADTSHTSWGRALRCLQEAWFNLTPGSQGRGLQARF